MPTAATHTPLPACWILDRAILKWQRKSFTIVAVMDLQSRKALHWQLLRPLTPKAVANVLDETIRQNGTPPALVVGADPVFHRPALLDSYQTHHCQPVDLRQGKSSVAIFMRSLWKNLVWEGLSWRQPQTEAEFRQAVNAWFDRYNHERPHQALGYKTPAEQWQQTTASLATAEPGLSGDTIPQVIPLTIHLAGIQPPIWRRVLVRPSMTFAQLHQVIQLAMGWTNAHLHEFRVNAKRIGPIYDDLEGNEELVDETQVRLQEVLSPTDTLFHYTYDFGDDWEHQLQIEPKQPAQAATQYPVCVSGERNCPPEDCGGVPGYEKLLAVLSDKAHPERNEWLAWLGRAYNPDALNLTTINRQLAMRFR